MNRARPTVPPTTPPTTAPMLTLCDDLGEGADVTDGAAVLVVVAVAREPNMVDIPASAKPPAGAVIVAPPIPLNTS